MARQPIAVLGAGSWGTALAIHLARNGVDTRLWGWKEDEMRRMAAERRNEAYLPGIEFPDALSVSWELDATIGDRHDILVVVPSHAFVDLLKQIKPLLSPAHRIAWATKGLVPDTGALLSSAVDSILGASRPKAVLSGPTFAKELAAGQPSACALAATDNVFLDSLVEQFHSPRFRVYRTDDLVGVQLGGAVKNIIAVGAGMAEGVGFGANARAALITRGLAELVRLGGALGARQETLYGLAGLGDLVLTATDNQSRNRRFGLALGEGRDMQEAIASIGQVVEAVRNTREVRQLARRLDVDMPIVEAIYGVLYEGMAPLEAAELLLTRELKPEGE
jgi:glycerol-3-phosphate dehydrogenase (NAD(P)+)